MLRTGWASPAFPPSLVPSLPPSFHSTARPFVKCQDAVILCSMLGGGGTRGGSILQASKHEDRCRGSGQGAHGGGQRAAAVGLPSARPSPAQPLSQLPSMLPFKA